MGTSCLLTLSPNVIVEQEQEQDQEQEDELPKEVPGGHAESHRKVSGPGARKQGDDVLVHQLCVLRCRQGELHIHGHSVQVLGGEQAWGGRGYDAKHIEVGHWRENIITL